MQKELISEERNLLVKIQMFQKRFSVVIAQKEYHYRKEGFVLARTGWGGIDV